MRTGPPRRGGTHEGSSHTISTAPHRSHRRRDGEPPAPHGQRQPLDGSRRHLGVAESTTTAVPGPGDPPLRALARHEAAGRMPSTPTPLANDAMYRRLVAQEFDSVTPENVMKWEVVEPKQGQYDFSQRTSWSRSRRRTARRCAATTSCGTASCQLAHLRHLDLRPQLRAILKEHIFDGGRALPRADLGLGRRQRGDSTITATCVTTSGRAPSARATSRTPSGGRTRPIPRPILFYNDYNIDPSARRATPSTASFGGCAPRGCPSRRSGSRATSARLPLPQRPAAKRRRFAALRLDTAVTEADVRHTLPSTPAKVNAQAQGFSLMLQAAFSSAAASRTRSGVSPTSTTGCPPIPGQGEASAVRRELPAEAGLRHDAPRPGARAHPALAGGPRDQLNGRGSKCGAAAG